MGTGTIHCAASMQPINATPCDAADPREVQDLTPGSLSLYENSRDNNKMIYDDGRVSCDENQLVIHWYYPWGSKRIPYSTIEKVSRKPLTVYRGKWRIWGSGDFIHWWNLDTKRPSKKEALILSVGGRILPSITPDDIDRVETILTQHIS